MPALDGRVALVTGGARGIGLAIARACAAAGASVVVADNGASIDGRGRDADALPAAIAALGKHAAGFADDLAQPGAPEAAVAFAIERFGAIDLVVNNAAILRDALIFKAARADWETVLATNLHAPFALLAAASGAMREQAKVGRAPGRIVNVVSSAGLVGNFGQAAYAAAKAGLFGLTRVVAMDLARSGITCNAVAPFAATRVTDTIVPANEAQARYKARAASIPAAPVADLVVALCLDSNRFTGQLFGVRGAETFVFSQPRPARREVRTPTAAREPAALLAWLADTFAADATDLVTDLELFDTEPVLQP
jgi:NAD(P)-dependent dehydrogenase (short-subunit alcohol dehydrogenase family)